MVLIALSLLLIDSQQSWPGALAALPVLGAMMVILGNWQRSRWVCDERVQSIGRWSYSIYLWHWPIVVAMSYLELRNLFPWKVIGIVMAIGIGALSFRYIESNARKALERMGQTAGSIALIGISSLSALLAAALYLADGVPQREMPAPARLADEERLNREHKPINEPECQRVMDGALRACRYGNGPIGVIVLGDSHAIALVTAVAESIAQRHASVLSWAFHACPTVLGVTHSNKSFMACSEFNRNAIDALKKDYPNVPLIVVNRWAAYINGPSSYEGGGRRFISFVAEESDSEFRDHFMDALESTTCELSRTGRRVFLVQPVPEMPFNVPKHMARRAMFSKKGHDVVLPLETYKERNANVFEVLSRAKMRCGVELLDPALVLCTPQGCMGSVNGRPIYYDDNHLSEFGNKLLVPMFRDVLAPQS